MFAREGKFPRGNYFTVFVGCFIWQRCFSMQQKPSYELLYVDGKPVGQSFRKKPVGSYPWYAKGKKPGTYRLALAAKDLAGNQTSTRAFAVVLRFVELTKPRYVTHGRVVRVRVSTDAKKVR